MVSNVLRSDYFNANLVTPYNAIYNMIISNRTWGKTWGLKKRAFKRAIKHGRKTIWIRTFEKEKKECAKTFFGSADLCKFCGVELYDSTTKTGNVKQNGNTFYYKKKNGSWDWFLKIFKITDSTAIRSADDVHLDTVVYDEVATTPEAERRVRGNRVDMFNDIFFSSKREHKLTCFFLGNKESPINPFLTYFNVPQFPSKFEGIRTFRNGSFLYLQRNNPQKQKSNFDKSVADLFKGTPYGNYIYESEYKNQSALTPTKCPKSAMEYIQLSVDGNEFSIMTENGKYYVRKGIDKHRRVYTIQPLYKYEKEIVLVKSQKKWFVSFVNAISDSNVFYENLQVNQMAQPFLKWLGI